MWWCALDGVDNASIYKIKKRNYEITKYKKLYQWYPQPLPSSLPQFLLHLVREAQLVREEQQLNQNVLDAKLVADGDPGGGSLVRRLLN